MHLKDLLFLLPKISFFPNLHPEMFPEYVFERGFTNSASFFTEKRGASFSQFPLHLIFQLCVLEGECDAQRPCDGEDEICNLPGHENCQYCSHDLVSKN